MTRPDIDWRGIDGAEATARSPYHAQIVLAAARISALTILFAPTDRRKRPAGPKNTRQR